MRRLSPAGIVPVVLLTSAGWGCGSASLIHQAHAALPPNEVERRVEEAFTLHAIPVAERTPDGRVRSGTFDPVQTWGAQAAAKTSCGVSALAGSGSRAVAFRLEVLATVRSNRRAGSRVAVESYGRGRTPEGTEVPCALSESVVEAILRSVSGGEAPGRR